MIFGPIKFKPWWQDWMTVVVIVHIALAWIFGLALLLRWLAS